MSRTTPTSSVKTPTLLIRAIRRTPAALITVVRPIKTQPSRTAFLARSAGFAPSPMSWKMGAI